MTVQRAMIKSFLVLLYLVGLGLVLTWFLSVPRSDAAGGLAPLAFKSPLGDPRLSLSKSVDINAPKVGDIITYRLTFSNTRSGSEAYNVRLYEFLPAGVQLVSSNPPPTSFENGVLLYTTPSLTSSVGAPENTLSALVRVRILEGYEGLYNHALVTADCVTPTQASLLKSVEQPAVSLSLDKVGYQYVLTDSELVYTLLVNNESDVTVNDVTVLDVLPTGLPLVDTSLAMDMTRLPLLRWTLNNLGPGDSQAIVITTTSPAVTGIITNTAMVDARQRVVTETLFATHVVSEGAILLVEKTGSAPKVSLGDQLVYTLRYWNAGNRLADSVRLTDTLPADVVVTGVYPTPTLQTAQRIVWSLDTLTPTMGSIGIPGQVVITVTVKGQGGRTLVNVADITGVPDGSYSVFPGQDRLETPVRLAILYLPLVTRQY